jgi:hypothetical protein
MAQSIVSGDSRHASVRQLSQAFRRYPLIFVAFGVAAVILIYALFDAPAAKAAGMLEEEFAYVSAPSAAQLVRRYSTHKPGQADVGAEYRAAITYDALRLFYDEELDAHGWQLVSDRTVTDWGRDLGGHVACYRKADYWAILGYSGGPGQGYVIDFVWGSSVCAHSR